MKTEILNERLPEQKPESSLENLSKLPRVLVHLPQVLITHAENDVNLAERLILMGSLHIPHLTDQLAYGNFGPAACLVALAIFHTIQRRHENRAYINHKLGK